MLKEDKVRSMIYLHLLIHLPIHLLQSFINAQRFGRRSRQRIIIHLPKGLQCVINIYCGLQIHIWLSNVIGDVYTFFSTEGSDETWKTKWGALIPCHYEYLMRECLANINGKALGDGINWDILRINNWDL